MATKQIKKTQRGLLHARQTGKRHANANTSFPLLMFILLSLGALLMNLTFQANAAEVKVLDARVPGVAPTQSAIITTPTTETTVSAVPLTVSGTCPAATIVKLFRNGLFSGATMCNVDGNFSLSTDLFVGANDLTAHVFNLGDTEGPTSPIVRVKYVLPETAIVDEVPSNTVPSTASQKTTDPKLVASLPFLLKTEVFYRGYYVGDTVQWRFNVEGGTSPYAVSIDWGDGKTSVVSIKEAGVFDVTHIYGKPGSYKGGYDVKLMASDSSGKQTYLQVVAIVNNLNGNSAVSSSSGSSAISEHAGIIWSAYSVVLFMTISFWLGQRRGLALFVAQHKPRRIRPHHS